MGELEEAGGLGQGPEKALGGCCPGPPGVDCERNTQGRSEN